MDKFKNGASKSAKQGDGDGVTKGKSSSSNSKSKKNGSVVRSPAPSTSTMQPPLPKEPPPRQPPPPLPPSGIIPKRSDARLDKIDHASKESPLRQPSTPLPAPSGIIPKRSDARLDKLEQMIQVQWEASQQFQQVVMSALSLEVEEPEEGYGYDGYYSDGEDDTQMEYSNGDNAVQSHEDTHQEPNAGTFIERFTGTAGMGAPVSEGLAGSLKFMLTEKLDEKVLTEVMDLYEIPVNLSELRVPKVNATIWENVSSKARSSDLQMQRIQKCLVKGLTALTKDMDNPTASQQDALACLASGYFESNMLRRELIKPELNPKYSHLCKPSIIVTEQLFGDDLSRQIKDLDEAQKATGMVMKQKMPLFKKQRYGPYGNFRGRGRGRGASRMPFLGGGQLYQGPQQWVKRGRGRGNRPRFVQPYQPQLQQQSQVQIQQ